MLWFASWRSLVLPSSTYRTISQCCAGILNSLAGIATTCDKEGGAIESGNGHGKQSPPHPVINLTPFHGI